MSAVGGGGASDDLNDEPMPVDVASRAEEAAASRTDEPVDSVQPSAQQAAAPSPIDAVSSVFSCNIDITHMLESDSTSVVVS